MYTEEDFLDLAGIQKFAFCRRQWALTAIEDQWEENLRTAEGSLLHENAHDANFTEKRGEVITARGMPVRSYELGTSGICDVVEFRRAPDGVAIHGRDGKYRVSPVEYKRGAPKENDVDVMQLAAQAMCLEEMLCCDISVGYLFYFETRHRVEVQLTAEVKDKVRRMFDEMHSMFERRYTPKVRRTKSCNACSLLGACLPVLCGNKSAMAYIEEYTARDDHGTGDFRI